MEESLIPVVLLCNEDLEKLKNGKKRMMCGIDFYVHPKPKLEETLMGNEIFIVLTDSEKIKRFNMEKHDISESDFQNMMKDSRIYRKSMGLE